MLSSPPPHLPALRWASLLLAVLVLAAAVPAAAQTAPPQTPPPDTAPSQPAAAATPPTPAGPSRIHYGVRFGPSFTSLTSVEPFDDTATTAAFEPTMNFGGLRADRSRPGHSRFSPKCCSPQRGIAFGTKMRSRSPTSTGELQLPPAHYSVLVRYLEFPLLLRMSKRTHENTSVYLIGGAAFALLRNAEIREVADPGRHEDIDDLVSGSHLSYIFGAGLQHRRWLVDARFVRGLRNIASDPGRCQRQDWGVFSADGRAVLVG